MLKRYDVYYKTLIFSVAIIPLPWLSNIFISILFNVPPFSLNHCKKGFSNESSFDFTNEMKINITKIYRNLLFIQKIKFIKRGYYDKILYIFYLKILANHLTNLFLCPMSTHLEIKNIYHPPIIYIIDQTKLQPYNLQMNVSPMVIEDLYSNLLENFKEFGSENIEIEARIGEWNNRFINGITKEEYELLKRFFINDPDFTYEKKIIIDYFYKNFLGKKYRVSYDEQNQIIESIEKKRLKNFQYSIGNYYTWRISASAEVDNDEIAKNTPQGSYINKRNKNRLTFKNKLNSSFIIDLTWVQSEDGHAFDNSYELEIELTPSNKIGESLHILSSVMAKIDHILTEFQEGRYPEIRYQLPNSIHSEVFIDFQKALQVNDSSFIGTYPVNLDKQIHLDDYYVSVHPAGKRYLLFIHQSKGVFLISESNNFYLVPELDRLTSLAEKGHIILDGDMVRHRQDLNPFYLISDCICYEGKSIVDQPFDKRILYVGKIVNDYRMKFSDIDYPFFLIGKPIVKVEQFKFFKGSLNVEKHYFQDKKRYHDYHGFILIPGKKKYEFKTNYDMYYIKEVDYRKIKGLLNYV